MQGGFISATFIASLSMQGKSSAIKMPYEKFNGEGRFKHLGHYPEPQQ